MTSKFEVKFQDFIQSEMNQDAAHDYSHVKRVVATSKQLCAEEQADIDVVLPAAYLHDCFSFAKNHPQKHMSSWYAAEKAIRFLRDIAYPEKHLEAIHHAIVAHSFSAQVEAVTLEAKVVQDADRLDALGAIGIARCVQVSTLLDRPLYNHHDPFCRYREPEDNLFCIDHFYTKLFTVAERMNTQSGKDEAAKRVEFMRAYLAQLKQELGVE